MTNALTVARDALAEALREALGEDTLATVHDHVPDELTGRDVVLTPATNYLLPSETFDPREYVATYEVFVLIGGEDNAEVHEGIADLLPVVLLATAEADWHVTATSRLVAYETSDWSSYGVAVTAQQHLTL